MWKAASWYNMWLRIREIVLRRGFRLAWLWHKFLWYEFCILTYYDYVFIVCGVVFQISVEIIFVSIICGTLL